MKRKHVCWIATVVTIVVCVAVATVLLLQTPAASVRKHPPTVQVQEGVLQGQWLPVSGAEDAKQFAAFTGVPYAHPPVGPLRFKAPRPPLQWNGTRDATEESADCWQQSSETFEAVGSEDCLYLNVYSPDLPEQTQKLLPVYFFIHGGTFLFGTSNYSWFGPEFLMMQNIVVVTIKYRLNVFGFLNLDNEIVPGNAGIKDQIAALKWVSENIAKFGGDPNEITVGGQSAGAVSAHWLALLPESRDLFKRVLLESGSALHSFGYNEDNFAVADDLGRALANKTITIAELAQLVMSLPPKDLMAASMPMAIQRSNTLATQIPYAPSIERRVPVVGGEKPLITNSPETLIIDPTVPQKPMFVGMNNREWLAGYYAYGYGGDVNFMNYRIRTLINLLPKNIIPYIDTIEYLKLTDVAPTFQWSDVTDAVDHNYFRSMDMNCNLTCIFKKYLDDIVIGVDTNRLVDLRSSSKLSTTYVYRFSLRSDYSISALVDPDQSAGGAVHSDELGYIWRMSGLRQKLNGDDLASRTLQRMTNMWGSYIRTGIPSPDNKFTWQPTENRVTGIRFLEIQEELEEKDEDIGGPNMPFWFNLYQQYRKK
ncbi:esterase E4-like [Thrips palmi]|uniref:Carboxylic ester hydrolase n=1 Tax=Thrips palmi TaxID=161013 RepID=A0A6P8YWA1_THRPL|nr:esterase E4-like [Thrips palmi]